MTTNAFVKRFLEGSEGVQFLITTNKVKKLFKHYGIEYNKNYNEYKRVSKTNKNNELAFWKLKTIINKESEKRASNHTEEEKKQYCQEVLSAIEYYKYITIDYYGLSGRDKKLMDVNHPGKKILLSGKKFHKNIYPECYLESLFYTLKYHYYFIYLKDQLNSLDENSQELVEFCIKVLLDRKQECHQLDFFAYYIFHEFADMIEIWEHIEPKTYLDLKEFLDLASQYFEWSYMIDWFEEDDFEHPNIQPYLADIDVDWPFKYRYVH